MRPKVSHSMLITNQPVNSEMLLDEAERIEWEEELECCVLIHAIAYSHLEIVKYITVKGPPGPFH